MHKTIFTWLGNLPTSTKLQGFHYYQGKYKVRLQFSHSLTKQQQQQKPQSPKTVFTSCTQDSQWVRKRAKNFLEGVVQQKSDSFLGQEYVEPSPVIKKTHWATISGHLPYLQHPRLNHQPNTPYQNHMQHNFV